MRYVYNDAYRSILGPTKHPAALGRTQHENFPEIRAFTEPMYDRIFSTGQAEHYDDLQVILYRSDFMEEVYVTIDNSPIRDSSGELVVIYHPLLETTGSALGARRLKTLSDLGKNFHRRHPWGKRVKIPLKC